MRILICGLGSIGQRHIRNLLALGADDFVLYRTGKGALPDDEFQHFPGETDLTLALDRWAPDAVVVANPTSLHLEVAVAAAEAGSHILLEKPISHSLARVGELRQLVKSNKVNVLVGYQFRFHKGFRRIKALIERHAIGQIFEIRAMWGEYLPDWHPWEDYRQSYSARRKLGGGVVLTLSHPFDYLHWMFGPVRAVTAEAKVSGELDLDVEDSADIDLEFSSGLAAKVHLDYLQKPGIHRLALTGDQGAISWDSQRGRVLLSNAEGERSFPAESPPDPRNQMFLDEAAHFMEVVRGEAAPICTFEDGIHALEIALAAYRSSDERRKVLLSELKTNRSEGIKREVDV